MKSGQPIPDKALHLQKLKETFESIRRTYKKEQRERFERYLHIAESIRSKQLRAQLQDE